uniref:Putative phospholipase ddhd2 n=1 Tax=Ornithodoros turicata TaxID=34597 RepID=A0A2R5LCM6_9ACAR
MPVSQLDANTEGSGTSTYQATDGTQPPTNVATSMQETVPSGPFSQLQQPLRPMQSPSQTTAQSREQTPLKQQPVVSPFPQGIPQPPTASYAPTQQIPLQDPANSSPVGPPPMGPPRDFHRQSPFTHATLSGSVLPPPNPTPPPYMAAATVATQLTTTTTPLMPTSPPVTPSMPPMGTSQDQSQFVGYAAEQRAMVPSPPSSAPYVPVKPHWFFNKEIEKKSIWIPFTMLDSSNLEETVMRNGASEDTVISTDGGRYDVHVHSRLRYPVYWEEQPTVVRRCSWFYKVEGQNRFVPYEEDIAAILEEHYQKAVSTGVWHQRLELPGNQVVVMHSTSVMVHFLPSSHPDEWGNISEGQTRPRVVKRGVEEVETIEDGEPTQVDHVVFVVHGVGSVCDFRFRSVEECLDDIRNISLGLTKTHFAAPLHEGKIGRIEFLPVSWHSTLHGDATGIDSALKHITLNSIPKLRHFTNDTLLDILFYTSPVYCQTIVDTVGSEMSRLYDKFMERNPNFTGTVALAGHSLGSLILYDILSHQPRPGSQVVSNEVPPEPPAPMSTLEKPAVLQPPPTSEGPQDAASETVSLPTVESIFDELSLGDFVDKIREERVDLDTLKMCTEGDLKEMGLPMGPRKKLLSYMKGLAQKQEQEKGMKEQCKGVAPETPVQPPTTQPQSLESYKRESLASVNYSVGLGGTGQISVSYPMINFNPSCFFALGSPIAMFLVVRGNETLGDDFRLPTCPAFFNIFHPFDPVAYRIENLIDPNFTAPPVLIPHHKGRKRMHLELRESLSRMGSDLKQKLVDSLRYTWNSIHDFARAHRFSAAQVEAEMDSIVQEEIKRQEEATETESTVTTSDLQGVEDLGVGQLNGGRRIDYVLQEKPIESFNEYLFALASHACYWESEDTVLLILKELYALNGIAPKVPGRSYSQPKVQLYNPAIQSSPFQSPVHGYQSSPSIELQNAQRMSPVVSPQATIPAAGVASSLGPVAPPPLQGFVRTSPLVRK